MTIHVPIHQAPSHPFITRPFDHRKYAPFPPIHLPQRRWPAQVISKAPDWCSVDLRDGNQALVRPMSVAQKQRLFDLLVRLGFKEIEIGFPAASQTEFDFCRQLIEQKRIPAGVTVQVLTQARPELIARTFDALRGVDSAILHLYNSTSPVQREAVFGLDRAGIKAIAVAGATQVRDEARKYPQTRWTFQYSPESFTATELDFSVEVIDAVNQVWRPNAGQPVIINLPATVEVATPNVFADQVEWVARAMAYRESVRISVHTHNDRGCAVAAAELAVMAGADRVEGTLLGNGERTGNMDLITMAMNLYSQGIDPQLDLAAMADIVETIEQVTDIHTHPRHPYAGSLVFTAFSGSHQDAIRKCLQRQPQHSLWQVAYLPIDPQDLGRSYDEVVRINSQSGKGGVAYVLERDYGIRLPRWLSQVFSPIVQAASEASGGDLTSLAVRQLFETHLLQVPRGWAIRQYQVQRTEHGDDKRVRVTIETDHPEKGRLVGQAGGPVEALAQALSVAFGVSIAIDDFEEFALTSGARATAMACVKLTVAGASGVAAASSEDTSLAALQAVLSGFACAMGSQHRQSTQAINMNNRQG